MFLKSLDALRSAGATVMSDEAILPASFETLTDAINTRPFLREGLERFLKDFGPMQYHSTAEFARAVGAPIPLFFVDAPLRNPETDPGAEASFFGPQRIALAVYQNTLERYRLDGYVYPALQMPPNDETIPQPGGRQSEGPHSQTGWTNTIGVQAVTVPGGFYSDGLPFGVEFSARPWKDGDLLGWAFAFEQATQYRKPPVLTDRD